jgi:hypothetical protein
MSRKHTTRRQQRGNGWLDPRGTREAHESRDMTNRKHTPMSATRGPKATRVNKKGRKH